jgi:hypothetical protein
MKRNIYIILGFILLLGVSCEKNLEELNLDPTRLTQVDLRLMLPEIQSQAMFNEGNGGSRAIGIIMQQFFGLDAQQLAYNDYILGEDLMNNYWNTGLYAGVLRSCDVMIKQAEEEGASFYTGVGKVIMAAQFGIATSWFGDIPFSDALKGAESLKPAYDSQEAVYNGVLTMLNEAIATLGSATGYGGGDLIYGGDAALWIKTAKGLKARFLIHQAKRKPANFTEALTELAGSYSSFEEQSLFTFGTAETQNYSLAKFGIERPSTLGFHPQFAAMLEGDPRAPFYYKESGGSLQYYDPTLPFARNDASIPMLSYAEVKFMEAEAKAATGSDASSALKAAIMANMAHVGVDAAAGEAYADEVIAGGVDVETILTEAYKAYYGYNFSTTWANYRRTGVPNLTPSSNGANGLNPSGGIPRRFIYVAGETQTNSENVAAARANQGGALLDADVWAFE